MALTHNARVQLRTGKHFGGEQCLLTKKKEDLRTSPSSPGFDSVLVKKKCSRTGSVTSLKWIPTLNSKRPTRATSLRITVCTVLVGLVARLCDSQPQAPGSTLGLSKTLQSSNVFYYFEIDSNARQQTTDKRIGVTD